MAKQLIIYMPDPGEDRVEWAMADDVGKLENQPQAGTLADAAAATEGLRAVLVLRGGDVLLSEVRVPGASAARIQQAVPFALEDQLADDVDDLHFALGSRLGDDRWPVAVIAHDILRQVTDACAAAGLRPARIVPEPLALPAETIQDGKPLWHALLDADELVVRLDCLHGFATDADLAPLAFLGALKEVSERQYENGAGGNDNDSDGGAGGVAAGESDAASGETVATIALYHTYPEVSLDLPLALDIDWRPCSHRLELHAAGLARGANINILQGDFSPRQGIDKAWKVWRWSVGLAAVLAGVWFGSQWLDHQRLADREAWLDDEIQSAFEKALPGTRMRRPRRQIEAAIATGNGSGAGSFTASLSHIAESLAAQPQTKLRSLGYRDGRFDLDLETDAVPTLDALQRELQERGSLNMTVQSANRQDNVVRGRVRIQ
ncbi:MAG: type II secretion system protein GspL [Gammaproteobacteria bacterium]|nr:MAG: type II secretion system protein GspL [Gammaproteobacteria bacterium]